MLRFANPEYLYLLIVIPLLVAIMLFMDFRQRRNLRQYGDVSLLKELMPDASALRHHLKYILTLCAFALLVFMMARPQEGAVPDQKREGIEALICMDISNSMLAEDVQPSRLQKSKNLVSKLVDNFEDDKVGLIVFAGDAYTQLPITADFVSAKMFLDQINPGLIDIQGTDFAAAINLATHSFTSQENVGKAIVIITDGENHEPGAVESAQAAAKMGMRVYVLGVGSDEGAPFRMDGESDYKRDADGNVVVTHLNQNMCKQLAQAGNGAYIHVDNSNSALDALEKELDKLSKAEYAVSFTEYNEQYWVFGVLALIILILEMVMMDKKNPLFKHIKLFKK